MDIGQLIGLATILPIVLTVVILLIAGVAVAIVFRRLRTSGVAPNGVFAQLGRALAAGEPMPYQEETERIGLMGEATILDVTSLESVAKNRTMSYNLGSLVLDVRLPGVAPYRAPCKQWFIFSQWLHISQGEIVPVRVHPQNAQLVFVDIAERMRAKQSGQDADREAHLWRQAELLGQNRR